MSHRLVSILCFVLAVCLALMLIYIEINIILTMDNFEEPSFFIPGAQLELRGSMATIAHLINFVLIMATVVSSMIFYSNLRK